MIVPSGNDAAEALAILFGKYLTKLQDPSEQKRKYIELMNEYAKEIGMKNFKILDEKGIALSYASAADVVLILSRVHSN